MQVGFLNVTATQEKQVYTALMSSVREVVEWNYKEMKLFFTSQDMKRNLKCREAPIARLYISAILLVNFKTCVRH